jgi:hypothetical protein
MEKRGVISEDDTPDYSDEGGRYAAPADALVKMASGELKRIDSLAVGDQLRHADDKEV